MRGRMRQFVLLLVLGAGAIVVLLFTYRKSSAPTLGRDDNNGGFLGTVPIADGNDINTVGRSQAEAQIDRSDQQKRLMLDKVRNLMKQKERAQLKDPDQGAKVEPTSRPVANPSSEPKDGAAVLSKRYVHLDLKGARPTMKYIRRLFPFLRALGATGLLIEYEDTFPYWGRLDDFRAHDSFTAQDIAEINRLAADNGLDIIPLVQTFGHMEFVLKRDGFKALREVPTLPQAICPSHNDTQVLVFEMINQLVALHPTARRLHIGCDEVYNVGECPRCQERMDRMLWTTEDLLTSHVKAVARHVNDAHRLRALVWDDMFRKVSADAIRRSNIGRYVDVVVWQYHDNMDDAMPADLWTKYADVFDGIWIASAFKGAAKPDSYATEVGERLSNHRHWMDVVRQYSGRVSFAGIFLTGWQRFDHFAVLCELLPVGLPSLAVDLHYLRSPHDWTSADEDRVRTTLGCNAAVPMRLVTADGSPLPPDIRCDFPGSKVYELSLQFHTVIADLNSEFFDSNYVRGWVSDYNLRTRFSSPALLEQAVLRYADAQRNLTFFSMAMEAALADVYDRTTVVEWLETYVKPLVARLETYHEKIKWLLVPNVWPRRPLNPVADEFVSAATATATTTSTTNSDNDVTVVIPEDAHYRQLQQHATEP